ncbi:MAG: hypothetical protein J1F35_03405 [Erysipelotrichales bacterium]|nr:hypothetical protein [Erysipelotrichales bacterium]
MDEVKTIKDKLHDATGLSYSFIDSKFEILNNEEITDEQKETFYTSLSWMIPSGVVNTENKKEILKTFREENNLPAIEENSELDIYEDPKESEETPEQNPETEEKGEDTQVEPEEKEESKENEEPEQAEEKIEE